MFCKQQQAWRASPIFPSWCQHLKLSPWKQLCSWEHPWTPLQHGPALTESTQSTSRGAEWGQQLLSSHWPCLALPGHLLPREPMAKKSWKVGNCRGNGSLILTYVKTLIFVKQRNKTFKNGNLFNAVNQNSALRTVKLNICTFSSFPHTRIYQPYQFTRADRHLLSNSTDQNLRFSGERGFDWKLPPNSPQ